MVETVIDPIRMPTVTLSQAEMDEIEVRMSRGELPPDFLDRYYDAVDANVFGHDAPKKDGNRQEQGIGSPGNQTRNSINAYKRYGKYEDDHDPEKFKLTIARMEAELAATNQARGIAGARRRGRPPGRSAKA